MKWRNWILSSVFLAANASAMTVETLSIQSFEGVLRLNAWQKSFDSYCAGGSEYFTLQQENEQNIVLATPEDVSTWQEFVDQYVSVQGVFETKILPTATESEPVLEQRPVVPMGSLLTCELLVVDSITLMP